MSLHSVSLVLTSGNPSAISGEFLKRLLSVLLRLEARLAHAWDTGSTTSFSENFDDQMAYVDVYMESPNAVIIPKEDQTTVPKFWQRLNPKRVTGASGGYDMNIVTLGICKGLYGEWNLLCWDMEINTTTRTGLGGWLSESINHFVRPVFVFELWMQAPLEVVDVMVRKMR